MQILTQQPARELLREELPGEIKSAAHWWYDFGFTVAPMDRHTKHTRIYWNTWLPRLEKDGHKAIDQVFSVDDWLCAIVDDQVFVLDADTPESENALFTLLDTFGITPNLSVRTKSGVHIYLRRAPGTYAKNQGYSSSKHPNRIDIRTARSRTDGRGVIALPPSPGKTIEINEADTVLDLVEIGQDFIDAVFKRNGQRPPRAPEPRQQADTRRKVGDTEAAEILSHIPANCGYNDWLTVLMGVHDLHAGSDEGLQLLDQWSSTASNYCGAEELEYKYQTFACNTTEGVTFSSVCKLAADHGADLSAIAKKYDGQDGPLTKKRRLTFTRAADIKPRPVEWIVQDYLEAAAIFALFGDPETYKTFIVISLALSIATGRAWHGRAVRQCAVAYVCGEGQRGISRRIAGWCAHHDLDVSQAELYVSNIPTNLLDEKAQRDLIEALAEDVIQAQAQDGVLILDTIARNYGGDVNSATDVNAMFGFVDAELKRRFPGLTLILVGHPGLQDKSRLLGAHQWTGNVDACAKVERVAGQMQTKLVPLKMKDAETPPPILFDASPVTFEQDGERMDTLVLTHCAEGLFADVSAGTQGDTRPRLNDNQRVMYAVAVEEGKPFVVFRDDFVYAAQAMDQADPSRASVRSRPSLYRCVTRNLEILERSCHLRVTRDSEGTPLEVSKIRASSDGGEE